MAENRVQDSIVSNSVGKVGRGATKEDILLVATKVFAANGFRNTDVQEIADQLGIGKASIYRAFGTKEQLFFAAVDQGMDRLNHVMLEHECSVEEFEPPEKMRRKLFTFLSFFDQNQELIELLIQERSEFRDREPNSYTRNWLVNSPRWQSNCLEAIEKGRLRDLPAEGLVNMFSSLCYGAIFTHYFSKRKMDLQSTASLMADVMTFGLLSEEAREKHPNKQAKHHETKQ